MKYLMKAMLVLAWLFIFNQPVLAADYTLVISEATASIGSASNEFVEIYNHGDTDINLKNESIKLKLINSSGTATTKTITWTNEIIPAHGFFLFGAGTLAVSFDATYGGTLLTGNGGAMVTDKNDNILDKVVWSSLAAGSSLERTGGNLNKNDASAFFLQTTPNPQNSAYVYSPPSSPLPPPVYSRDIRINELLPNPSQAPEKDFEFVEFFNFGNEQIDLAGWKIKDKTAEHDLTGTIDPGNYAVFYGTVSLNNNGDEIGLYDPNGDLVSEAGYAGNAKEDYSYGFSDAGWQWSRFPTPGEINLFKKDYPEEIYFNEILPHPAGNEEDEFIELYNSSDKDLDLAGWTIKDSSKTSHYLFPADTIIKADDFLTVYRKDYKFALNDSGDESVFLLDPNEKNVSSVSYAGAKEEVSYNYDGAAWRWSRKITPGAENVFNNLPESKIKNDQDIYAGVPADFSAKAGDKDGDKLKFTWDFGDSHKSYLKKTRHKYDKPGNYPVTLKIFDGSEEKIETMDIEVKKYPGREVKIIKVVPNPAGNDSENEYLVVKNLSGKKINLKNWSVATGSQKMSNHPIAKNLFVGAGGTVEVGRKDSKFILNNIKGKIELRYPDGKAAYALKYESGAGGAAEDAAYEKTDGGWQWTEKEKTAEEEPDKAENSQAAASEKQAVENEASHEEEVQEDNSRAGGEAGVLGAEDTKPENAIQNPAGPPAQEKNTAGIIKKISAFINYFLNRLINFFR